MPTVLRLTFPARRYHATPWDSHVNEGTVEWPPSPWRILRALIATGFTKCGWTSGQVPDVAMKLIATLAESPPAWRLPAACVGHTRHYVAADGKKPLILDTWARIELGDALEVSWPVELADAEREMLALLADRLGYLGRAESWVEARVLATGQAPNCAPGEVAPGPGFEPVRVLCPMSAASYATWRDAAERRIDVELGTASQRKPTAKQVKERASALAPYPADLIDAVSADTGVLQEQGWSSPPGGREVVYWRRMGALAVGPTAEVGPPPQRTVLFALLAFSTPSRSTAALPPIERVFPQGRLLHRAIAARIGDAAEATRLTLLGKVGNRVADGQHQHAHLLWLDLGGVHRLDHALVWAPGGLDPGALAVLRRLRKTWMKGGAGELQVALVADGDAEVLTDLDQRFDGRISRVLGPGEGATQWSSATPYLAPRLTKRHGKDCLEEQIRRELVRRGVSTAVEISAGDASVRSGFRHLVLHDARHAPPRLVTHAIHLTFAEPVSGPIALGWGAHYGLGRFEVTHSG